MIIVKIVNEKRGQKYSLSTLLGLDLALHSAVRPQQGGQVGGVLPSSNEKICPPSSSFRGSSFL